MIGKEAGEGESVSLSRVKEILEDRKKGKELTYEQQLAYEHAKKFASLEGAKETKLRKMLQLKSILFKNIKNIGDVVLVSATGQGQRTPESAASAEVSDLASRR